MNELSAIWPIFGLTLTTPRLVLRAIQDADIPAAVGAALSGIHTLGVSASLGYEPNGSYRDRWGADVVEVQPVRLTPGSFTRPGWNLKVEGHEAAAKFLGL